MAENIATEQAKSPGNKNADRFHAYASKNIKGIVDGTQWKG